MLSKTWMNIAKTLSNPVKRLNLKLRFNLADICTFSAPKFTFMFYFVISYSFFICVTKKIFLESKLVWWYLESLKNLESDI